VWEVKMMKRFGVILLVIAVMLTAACSGNERNASREVVKPSLEGSRPEITILVSDDDEWLLKSTIMKDYINKFEEGYGVTIKLQEIGNSQSLYYIGNQIFVNEAVDEYEKELSAKLHQKDPPELIFYSFIPLNSLISQGVAEDVGGKISNLDKLHPGLLREEVYYIPINIFHMPTVLNMNVIKTLQVKEPNLTSTKQDYLEIRDKWLQQVKPQFTSREFIDIVAKYLIDLKIFNEDNSKVTINNAEMCKAIYSMKKEIYDGNYILPQDYTYANYYNMLFERQREEYEKDRRFIKSKEYQKNGIRNYEEETSINALRAADSNYMIESGNVVLPNLLEDKIYLYSDGFMINRNGKNKELAYEFVNGMLDNEVQLQIFKDSIVSYYPVNKEIEKEINSIEKSRKYEPEAIELKNYILKEIEDGNALLSIERYDREYELFWMLVKDLTKYIFADKSYTEFELKQGLQKLEDKYNIYLSE
jgi:maltose-binding protein MalE